MCLRVLNVEDDVMKNAAITRILKKIGAVTDWAKTGEEGLFFLESKPPYDVVVCDMQFSAGGRYNAEGGLWFAEEMKKLNIEIPIVFCSSSALNLPYDCIHYSERNLMFRKQLTTIVQSKLKK